MLEIRVITSGVVETNTYILTADGSREAVIIDPASDLVYEFVKKNEFIPVLIINTHGHFDHIAGNHLFEGVDIAIHKQDEYMLYSPEDNLSKLFEQEIISPEAGVILKEGDILDIAGLSLSILHTPGHTEGSISVLCEDVVFTGDTLFCGTIGRTDLPHGDYEKITQSIKKLMDLDDDIMVYPGHGRSTTIGRERKSNVYLCDI